MALSDVKVIKVTTALADPLADKASQADLDALAALVSGGSADLTALTSQLNTETAERLAADEALADNIADEGAIRASGDAALGVRVDDEEAARAAADAALQGDLTTYSALTDARLDLAEEALEGVESGAVTVGRARTSEQMDTGTGTASLAEDDEGRAVIDAHELVVGRDGETYGRLGPDGLELPGGGAESYTHGRNTFHDGASTTFGDGDRGGVRIDHATGEIDSPANYDRPRAPDEDGRVIELPSGTRHAIVFGDPERPYLSIDTISGVFRAHVPIEGELRAEPPSLYVNDPPGIFYDTTDPDNTTRPFQCIPAAGITGDRLWCAHYGGDNVSGTGEYPGDFAIFSYSDDHGVTWTEYCYFRYPDRTKRISDLQFVTAGNGDLWVLIPVNGGNLRNDGVQGIWASVCTNPLAAKPGWCRPFRLDTVGFPGRIQNIGGEFYLSRDYWLSSAVVPLLSGKTICRLDMANRKLVPVSRLPDTKITEGYYETSLIPLRDGRVMAQWRTASVGEYCIGDSAAGPWSAPLPITPLLGDTLSSRMCGFRTAGGRPAIVYNNTTGGFSDRTNMKIAISDDDGTSFAFALMLDTRPEVSYPSVALDPDGDTIHILYDRRRGVAGEIVHVSVKESEILAGTAVAPTPHIISVRNPPL